MQEGQGAHGDPSFRLLAHVDIIAMLFLPLALFVFFLCSSQLPSPSAPFVVSQRAEFDSLSVMEAVKSVMA
jgi:hypothetical protein